jgi:hypothetical protein
MQNKKRICLWSILLVILIILTIIFSARTIHKYELWTEHEEYLTSNQSHIENWMHINLISQRSGIPKESIYAVIGIEDSFTNSRKPLYALCEENNLNCTTVVARLNNLVESGKLNTSKEKI